MTMPTPGCSRLTISRPSSSETIEAQTNQAMVLAPTRPTVAASPIWPMPTISVDSTSGPMIILINFRKIPLTKRHVFGDVGRGRLVGERIVAQRAERDAEDEPDHHVDEIPVHHRLPRVDRQRRSAMRGGGPWIRLWWTPARVQARGRRLTRH